jgi:aminopeptidase-like protein
MSLIEYFKKIKKLNKTIRFIFIPETIGSIVYLSKNLSKIKDNVIGGYNLSCIGDERMHSCMFSKYANSPSDASLIEAYKKLKIKYKRFSFLKRGSDERQFNSPGIDIPITSIFRTMYGEYPEYHTSLDDFKLVTLKGISGGFKVASNAIEILLKKIIPKNTYLCEPQMGKRGLYEFKKKRYENFMSFLQYADGKNDLSMISKKIKVNLKLTKKIYLKLKKNKLIY